MATANSSCHLCTLAGSPRQPVLPPSRIGALPADSRHCHLRTLARRACLIRNLRRPFTLQMPFLVDRVACLEPAQAHAGLAVGLELRV